MKKILFTFMGLLICVNAHALDGKSYAAGAATVILAPVVLATVTPAFAVLAPTVAVTGMAAVTTGLAAVGTASIIALPVATTILTIKAIQKIDDDHFVDVEGKNLGCNTADDTHVDVGYTAFCQYPQTNTCMNTNIGKTNQDSSLGSKISSIGGNDEWEGCKNTYCRGYSGSVPENAIPVMDNSSYKCWWWSCVNGFTQKGDRCACIGKKPYITKDAKGITVCAECTGKNQYRTKNAEGETICAVCNEPYILDGEKCIEKPKPVNPVKPKPVNPVKPKPDDKTKPDDNKTDNRTECDKGTAGYVLFEGSCIKTDEKDAIEKKREEEHIAKEKADKIASLQTQIAASASASEEIETKYLSGKKSVWKNADGEFNKSRLASDSIAGVVLGASGGLITHSIIKKNQIKKGLEDVACFVGDSEVAEYGDEFTIGLN